MRRTTINRLLAALLFIVHCSLFAESHAATDAEGQAFLNALAASYTPWSSVQLDGKLRMDKLPVSPSVRIYMEKGKKLYISVRAPFVGEVGRLELDGTQLTAVNRMKKVWVREDLGQAIGSTLPVKTEDAQDLFLGRVFLTDYGTLSTRNMALCNVYDETDCWLLVPLTQPAGGSVRYGYAFDYQRRMQDLYVTTVSENYAALVAYSYNGRKTILDFDIHVRDKSYEATLTLDEPKWNPDKPLGPIEISNSWRRVDIRTFLKSF